MSPLPLPSIFHHVCTGSCSNPESSFNPSCHGSPPELPRPYVWAGPVPFASLWGHGMFCLACASPHTATALRYDCTSLSVQHPLLLETASIIIPHWIKLLGTHLKTLYVFCDTLCSCFLSFYPLLSAQKVWDSQPSAQALVGCCSTCVQLRYPHTLELPLLKQLAESLHIAAAMPPWVLYILVSCS